MAEIAEKKGELMTAEEVADLLRVHPNSVERWVACGWLPPPLRLGPAGRWLRWRRSVIDQFVRRLEGGSKNAAAKR